MENSLGKQGRKWKDNIKRILGRKVLRIGSGWNWFSIVSSGLLSY
jgi:hypothetical protein